MLWQDKLTEYPLYQKLIENYPIIKTEILNHINKPNILQDYPNYQVLDNKMIYEKYWKAAPCSVFKDEHVELNGSDDIKKFLMYLTQQFRLNCPYTYSIIKNEEDNGVLCNSFISRLMPGTIINPHYGWSKKYMRMHLGIVTDPECKITVGTQTQAWEDGKILAFNDGDVHKVSHNGTKERVIFSVDIDLIYLRQFMVS